MNMLAFGFSPPDLAIIAVLVLIIFGPQKAPELGRQIGQALREFRKLADEMTGAAHSVREEVESVYKPVFNPPDLSEYTSSATVERAVAHRPYDQEAEAMLPAVPPMPPGPPAAHAPDAKGQQS